jgi:hypothetical protein
MASGLLERVGRGDPHILESHARVLVFKGLSVEEIQALPDEAKLGPRMAVRGI